MHIFLACEKTKSSSRTFEIDGRRLTGQKKRSSISIIIPNQYRREIIIVKKKLRDYRPLNDSCITRKKSIHTYKV